MSNLICDWCWQLNVKLFAVRCKIVTTLTGESTAGKEQAGNVIQTTLTGESTAGKEQAGNVLQNRDLQHSVESDVVDLEQFVHVRLPSSMFESLPEGVFVDDDGNVSVYVNKDRVQPVALCPQPECPLPTDDVAQSPVSSSHSSMANASRTRKRKREPQKWKRNESKRKRNSGDAYVDSNGNVISAKVMGNPCHCRRNCFQLLTQDYCQKIFSSFWENGNFDVQNAYLYGQIRCLNANTSTQDCSRQYTYVYYVKGANGKDIRICREAFLGVHWLQNNRGRLGNIQTAIARGTIRYDTRCYFNVRSKADMNRLNLPHGDDN